MNEENLPEASVTYDHIQEWLIQLELCDAPDEQLVVDPHPLSISSFCRTLPELLSDGVVLCRLLNLLKPGCVDRIHLNTDQPFAAVDNIRRFLATYKTEFDWDNALFQVDDLYDEKESKGDFSKVFRVLLHLAQLADTMGIEPSLKSIMINKTVRTSKFSKDIYAISLYAYDAAKADELSFKESDIIRVLHMVDGGWWEGELKNQQGWFPSNYVKMLKEEEVELSDIKPWLRPSSPVLSVFASAKRIVNKIQKKRVDTLVDKHASIFVFKNAVIKELIGTEERYCKDLEHCINTFMDGLFSETDWLPLEDYSAIW
jgi:hypothetical protein